MPYISSNYVEELNKTTAAATFGTRHKWEGDVRRVDVTGEKKDLKSNRLSRPDSGHAFRTIRPRS